MGVYRVLPLQKQSLLQKIFKKYPKNDYIKEVENLLAEHEENLLAISISDINKLKSKYKIKDTDFKADRELLLDKYIALCLNDKRLEDSEKAQLSYLCKLLEVDESYLSNRITHEGVLIYKDMIKTAISDNQISETELQELKKLRDEFDISEHSGNDIYIYNRM